MSETVLVGIDSASQRLMYLTTWSPVSGALGEIMGPLGAAAGGSLSLGMDFKS